MIGDLRELLKKYSLIEITNENAYDKTYGTIEELVGYYF